MERFYQTIPSTNREFLYGKIIPVNLTGENILDFDGVHLFKTERDARIDWIRGQYEAFRNIPNDCFDEHGFPIEEKINAKS